jgi:Transposase DDE domain
MSQSTLLPVPRTVAGACRPLTRRPGLPFAEYLPAEPIHQAVRDAGGVFRERIFTPAVTLWTFLSQVLDPDHSCRQAVARLLAWRTAVGLPPCAADNSAYCKARGRLPEEALADLTRQAGRQVMEQAEGPWLWKGRRVKVADGTGLSMPDTPENQAAYPQPKKVRPGLGFPLLRLVVVFSLAVGTALDAAMGRFQGKGSGELSLFRSIDHVLEPGDVLLADRLFSDFWDVARARARGVDVVMRMHAGRAKVWFRGRGHSTANRRVWWRKPPRPSWMSDEEYQALPEWLRLRAVRVDVRRRGFRTRRLVLVTTLLDADAVTLEDLADLYRRRWQAELYLRSLKTTLGMDILRGKSPAMVRKEVWAHLLVYNVVRALMAQAARAAGVRPDEVSFAGALQTVNAFLPNLRSAPTAEEAARLCAALLAAIAEHRVGNRPDRYEPRAVKRRPKNFPRLKEPRADARRRLLKGAKRAGKKR